MHGHGVLGIHFWPSDDGKIVVDTPVGSVEFDSVFEAEKFLVEILRQELANLARYAQLVERCNDEKRLYEEAVA